MRRSLEILLAVTLMAVPCLAQEDDEFARAVVFGKRFFDYKDYPSAYEHFAKADAIHPDQPGLLYNMALILTKLQRYNEAQAKIDRYQQLFPAGNEVGLVKKLEYDLEFQREVQRKRQANQGYIELFNRGKFLFDKGDVEGALKIFQDAEQQRGNDPAVPFNQALGYEKIGDFVKATERYRRYLALEQNADDKAAVDQKIFALETEIDDMRTKVVCTFCGHKLPVGSTWCHRCWTGPYLTQTGRWNTRVCGTGASAIRTTYFADGRIHKNEDLPCVLKEGNFHQAVLYTPARQKSIQSARKSEGWMYSGPVIQSRTDPQGNQIKLEQGEYLERLLSLSGGELLQYAAHKSNDGRWLLEREDYVIDGLKFTKTYSFDPAGRISQEKVVYQNSSGCNHVITVTADYAYENDELTTVKFRGGYLGYSEEGAPETRWEGALVYAYDPTGRVEREEFVVTSHKKTYAAKPPGPIRGDLGAIYPGWKVKQPLDVLKRGDFCKVVGTANIGNQLDLRPFYTLSPNVPMLLPYGVTKISMAFTYPESFSVRGK